MQDAGAEGSAAEGKGRAALAHGQLTLDLPGRALREAWPLQISIPEAGARPVCTNRGLGI